MSLFFCMVIIMTDEKYEQLNLFDMVNAIAETPKQDNIIPLRNEAHLEVLHLDRKFYSAKANLYGKFKQLAMAIYSSYKWTDEQLLESAKIIYPYIGFRTNAKTSTNKVKDVIFVSDKKQQELGLFGKSDQTYCIPLYFRMQENEYYRRFLILSDASELYKHYTDTYYRKRKPFVRYSYISKAYLLGYAYLIQAIKSEFVRTKDQHLMDFSEMELNDLIKGLISGDRSTNYAFYDYAITNAQTIKGWQKDVATNFTLEQDIYANLGDDKAILQWDGYRDFERLLAFVKNYLDDNFKVIPTTSLTQAKVQAVL